MNKYILKTVYVKGDWMWVAFKKGNIFNLFNNIPIVSTMDYTKEKCIENLKDYLQMISEEEEIQI